MSSNDHFECRVSHLSFIYHLLIHNCFKCSTSSSNHQTSRTFCHRKQQSSRQTSNFITLCHQLALDSTRFTSIFHFDSHWWRTLERITGEQRPNVDRIIAAAYVWNVHFGSTISGFTTPIDYSPSIDSVIARNRIKWVQEHPRIIQSVAGARADRVETKTETADRTDWFSILSPHWPWPIGVLHAVDSLSHTFGVWSRSGNSALGYCFTLDHKLRRSLMRSSSAGERKFSWHSSSILNINKAERSPCLSVINWPIIPDRISEKMNLRSAN
jgi:hypothetical protein